MDISSKTGQSSQSVPQEVSPPHSDGTFLQVEHLSKSHQEGGQNRIVLEDATAQFARGEFAVILGKSGTGKTRCSISLPGLTAPNRGTVWLDGQT
jgi:putative ABC transport system ATP-binding protein